MAAEKLSELGENLTKNLGAGVVDSQVAYGELTLTVNRDQVASVLRYLRDDPKCLFTILLDVCGADYPGRAQRFDAVYPLLSPRL